MVTRLVEVNVPPTYVPPSVSIELVPGVELLKTKTTLCEAEVWPGARLPNTCGGGGPRTAPRREVVSWTSSAGTAPMFWTL